MGHVLPLRPGSCAAPGAVVLAPHTVSVFSRSGPAGHYFFGQVMATDKPTLSQRTGGSRGAISRGHEGSSVIFSKSSTCAHGQLGGGGLHRQPGGGVGLKDCHSPRGPSNRASTSKEFIPQEYSSRSEPGPVAPICASAALRGRVQRHRPSRVSRRSGRCSSSPRIELHRKC